MSATKQTTKGDVKTGPASGEQRSFPLGAVLSATTGRLCCGIDELYDILNHVTGDNLFTHVLPRAFRFASPLIVEAHPDLAKAGSAKNLARLDELIENVKARGESPMEGVKLWLTWMREPGECNLAESYAITCRSDIWLSFDPIAELESMVGKEKVVVVKGGAR